MTFSVRQTIADSDLEPFEFEDADGDMQTLPHAKVLTAEQAMRIFFHGQIEEVLNEVTESTIGTTIMAFPSFATEALIKAWMEHSDVEMAGGEPGKSLRPSPSSRSTAKTSKRTSRSAASRSRR